jgi:transposase InsO family protein
VSHLRQRLASEPVREGPPPRGPIGQRAEREQEQAVRRHAIDADARIVELGWSEQEAASFLNLSARTLRHWRHELGGGLGLPHWLGRPVLTAPRELRNEVFRMLEEVGPGIGLPTLRTWFPDVPRAVLDNMLSRYRSIWRRLNQQTIYQLHWPKPGRVWAIDFHGPRLAIDGLFEYLLAVRDLASGCTLLWQPVEAPTAEVALREMQSLMARSQKTAAPSAPSE